ncbi:hypothetical protein FGADI_8856 [Fusarium gaditjirri]|uniref:Uncharacterized protein n=1 Tax=Fusarium gaditjirri TaxID=282569 RepID=A0A8H4T1C3_9HYPO|nr:hypothetical protein FGADI_8856 [Fusarium gaditjirri]
MAAPRRSKRIQALSQTNQGSPSVTEAPKAPKKDHLEKRRKKGESQRGALEEQESKEHSKQEAPRQEARVMDQAARRAELEEKQADKETEKQEENRQKIEQSRTYLHRVLALDRKDGYAQQFWRDLASSVKCLADDSRFLDRPWDSLEESLQQKFLGYAPNIQELFDVPDMAPLVFQRWLWEVIDENFFSKKSKDIVWASSYWEAQGTIERYLQGMEEDMAAVVKIPNRHSTDKTTEHDFSYEDEIASHMFPHWRYTTMQFYMSLKDSPQSSQRIDPSCVVPIIAKALGQYFPQEPEEEAMKIEYLTTLENLGNAVVKMDFFFSANLTSLSHVFHHPITQQACAFPYSSKLEGVRGVCMRAIDGSDTDSGRAVDLVVEPMLQRRGDPAGFDYNVKTAVHPMRVCVAWLEDRKTMTYWASKSTDEEDDEDEEEEGVTEEEGEDKNDKRRL